MKGIDVSGYQGVIDWPKVKQSGIEFAIIKTSLTYQSRFALDIEESCRRNIPQAHAAGLHVGVFHYSCAQNADEARQEARYMLDIINGYKGMIDMPVYIDIEDVTNQWPLSNETLADICDAFGQEIEGAGYYYGIYSSLNFMDRLNVTRLERYDRWLAQLYDHVTYDEPIGMWQYSWTGRVPGISGNVDLDTAYRDYPTIIREKGLNFLDDIPTPEPEQTLHAGDVVDILPDATWWGGQPVPEWLRKYHWVIYEDPVGKRAVINRSTDGTYAIMSPVSTDYLKPYETPEEPMDPDAQADFAREYTESLAGEYCVTAETYLRTGVDGKAMEKLPVGVTVRCYGYHTGKWLAVVSPSNITGFVASDAVMKA